VSRGVGRRSEALGDGQHDDVDKEEESDVARGLRHGGQMDGGELRRRGEMRTCDVRRRRATQRPAGNGQRATGSRQRAMGNGQ
jgi:hypothetical protein